MSDATVSKPYVVFARRWRPQIFDDVVGQEHISQQLANAVESGRVGHAFLFRGPRGVGKTSMARILARALNCEHGPTLTPCGTCEHCRNITAGNAMDVIEIDAATHTQVDEMRQILQTVNYAPASMRHKIYIVDEVHMLSKHSFNALLKTLEEPPPAVKFIFATTDPQKIPETIRSRCQDFEFRRISTQDIVKRLSQILDAESEITVEPDERDAILEALARHAEGGMRDAQVALDQLISLSPGKITLESTRQLLGLIENRLLLETVRAIQASDTAKLLGMVDGLVESGSDLETYIKSLTQFVRDLLVLKAAPGEDKLTDIPTTWLEEIRAILPTLEVATLLNLGQMLFDLEGQIKTSSHIRFLVEFFFIKLTTVNAVQGIDAILNAAQSGGILPAPVAAPPQVPTMTSAPAQAVIPADEGTDPLAKPAAAVAKVFKRVAAPGDLDGIWREMTNLLWGQSTSVKNYLENSQPVGLDENVLTIGIPENDRLFLSRLRKPKNMEILSQILEQITGTPHTVKFVTVDNSPQSEPPRPTPKPAPAPVVREPEAPEETTAPMAEDSGRPARLDEVFEQYPFLRHVQETFQSTGVRLVQRPGGSHP